MQDTQGIALREIPDVDSRRAGSLVHSARSTANPALQLDSLGGSYIVLCFFRTITIFLSNSSDVTTRNDAVHLPQRRRTARASASTSSISICLASEVAVIKTSKENVRKLTDVSRADLLLRLDEILCADEYAGSPTRFFFISRPELFLDPPFAEIRGFGGYGKDFKGVLPRPAVSLSPITLRRPAVPGGLNGDTGLPSTCEVPRSCRRKKASV
jgi:hypothetical protein